MPPNVSPEQKENLDRAYTAALNIIKLDQDEVRNIVSSIFSPTEREKYFTVIYHRAALNFEHLVTIQNYKHFQILSMIARSLLEHAVEMAMMRRDPDAAAKIRLFEEVERLKVARDSVEYKKLNPDAPLEISMFEAFIANRGAAIDAENTRVWPQRNGKINHWSSKKLENRVKELKEEYEQLYRMYYARLSWFSHSGIIGSISATGVTLSLVGGEAFMIATKAYSLILTDIINEFQIYKGDPNIRERLAYAVGIPYLDTSYQMREFWHNLSGL